MVTQVANDSKSESSPTLRWQVGAKLQGQPRGAAAPGANLLPLSLPSITCTRVFASHRSSSTFQLPASTLISLVSFVCGRHKMLLYAPSLPSCAHSRHFYPTSSIRRFSSDDGFHPLCESLKEGKKVTYKVKMLPAINRETMSSPFTALAGWEDAFHEILGHLRPSEYFVFDDHEETAIRFSLRRTLLSLAVSCRGFLDPSLDMLWHSLDNVHPLLKLLPNYQRRPEDSIYVSGLHRTL